MVGPKEKRERALGVRLGLKGERSMSPKSATVRKPYRPGVHGPNSRPRALSEFGLQLREKSKFKLSYGVDDKNLRRLFERAQVAKGSTGAKMIELLERRLDNVIFQLGFAPSRLAARQIVVHGHIDVNKKKVKSPGYEVRKGDTISVRAGSLAKAGLNKRKEAMTTHDAPSWLQVDAEKMTGQVLALPTDVNPPFEINLLVESFSK
ncbi:MAG TPA: 30S ribosomal protein S4 [Candidatus Paceibacterota bacterium]|nr:30S ribosomal protein S4 [Candidatus Paceibacterota bacterium]